MTEHKQYHIKNDVPAKTEDYTSSENVVSFDKTVHVKNVHVLSDREFRTSVGQSFGRIAFSTLASGSVYSTRTDDYLVGVTNLSYAPIIGLPRPSLVGAGKTFIVKDEAGGAATTTITVQSAGEETIDGASTSTLTSNYQARSYYTDGANWFTK